MAMQDPTLEYAISGFYRDAVTDNNTLYLAVRDGEMGADDIVIFQTDRQNQMKRVSSYATSVEVHSLALKNGFLFLANGQGGIEVVDITDPIKPVPVAELPLKGYAHKIEVKNHHAYVAAGFGGLQVIDISDPKKIKRIAEFQAYPPPGETEDASEEEIQQTSEGPLMEENSEDDDITLDFDMDDLPAYEGDEPDITLDKLAKIEGALDLSIKDDHLFMAYGSAGLLIIDISNPLKPRLAGTIQTDAPAETVAWHAQNLYISTGIKGISLYDISNSETPIFINSARTLCYPQDLAAISHQVYVADGFCGSDGIQVFAIGKKGRLEFSHSYKGAVGNIKIENDNLYTMGLKEIRIFKLSE